MIKNSEWFLLNVIHLTFNSYLCRKNEEEAVSEGVASLLFYEISLQENNL